MHPPDAGLALLPTTLLELADALTVESVASGAHTPPRARCLRQSAMSSSYSTRSVREPPTSRMAQTRGRVVGGSRLDGGAEEMEAADSCVVS